MTHTSYNGICSDATYFLKWDLLRCYILLIMGSAQMPCTSYNGISAPMLQWRISAQMLQWRISAQMSHTSCNISGQMTHTSCNEGYLVRYYTLLRMGYLVRCYSGGYLVRCCNMGYLVKCHIPLVMKDIWSDTAYFLQWEIWSDATMVDIWSYAAICDIWSDATMGDIWLDVTYLL